jgi:exopolysaccharide biosynthesis polyprenyl glycosylphosphotransferase
MAARRLAARPELGLAPIGFLDRDPREGPADLPVLGASWDLERVVDEHDVDAVVIGFSTAPHRVLLSIVRRCWDLGVEVLVVPRLFEAEGTRTVVERIGGLPMVGVARGPVAGPRLRAKYLVERVITAALLVLLAPVMALVALAVLLTSGRPILYRAPRVGTGGRPFQMLKFRTMPGTPESRGEADAEWATEILREHGLDVDADAIAPAPQLTPIGHVLRRTSLDELPQLINVVRGEMALVGPRPERVQYAERFAPAVYRYAERHRVRPGITGWAQVHGLRGSTSLDDRVEWDLFYVENWTPWLDVRILARTVSAVWRGARKE